MNATLAIVTFSLKQQNTLLLRPVQSSDVSYTMNVSTSPMLKSFPVLCQLVALSCKMTEFSFKKFSIFSVWHHTAY